MSKQPIKTVQIILLRGLQWKGDPESPVSNNVFYFITKAQLAASLSCQQWPAILFSISLSLTMAQTVHGAFKLQYLHSSYPPKKKPAIIFSSASSDRISELLVLKKNFYQTWLTFRSDHQCLHNEKQNPSTGYVKTNTEHMIHSWSSQATQWDSVSKKGNRPKKNKPNFFLLLGFLAAVTTNYFIFPFRRSQFSTGSKRIVHS